MPVSKDALRCMSIHNNIISPSAKTLMKLLLVCPHFVDIMLVLVILRDPAIAPLPGRDRTSFFSFLKTGKTCSLPRYFRRFSSFLSVESSLLLPHCTPVLVQSSTVTSSAELSHPYRQHSSPHSSHSLSLHGQLIAVLQNYKAGGVEVSNFAIKNKRKTGLTHRI